MSVPAASVVVCTRNRPDDLERLLVSIESNVADDVEVIVVDQSDSASVRAASARVRHIRTDTVGLSVARNVGLRAATAPIVVMTDDDCEVTPGWVEHMSAPFADETVALAYGRVTAGPADWSMGFIPISDIRIRRRIDRLRSHDPRVGIGANMSLRRDVALAIGGFDERLGAGADFVAGEEIDMALRLLRRGHAIMLEPGAEVVHHGFRTFEQGRQLVRGYALGSGAAYAKLLKCGHVGVAASFARSVSGLLLEPTIGAIRRKEIPRVLGRARYLAAGVWRGFRAPVDRTVGNFRPPARG